MSRLPVVCLRGAPLPTYATAGAAGFDLVAWPDDEELILYPTERLRVPTGLQIALPPGTEGQIRPRSGLAAADGLTVLNAPGTIDSDYRGEIEVLLVNLGQAAVRIKRGQRIAQLVVAPVIRAQLQQVAELEPTDRGAAGFGHTGAS
jgi:dUTP pyrophosphatase